MIRLLGPIAGLRRQFARHTLVGALAAAVDFGALYLLTEAAGLHYLVSAAVAFLFGLAVNYMLSRTWVFAERALDDTTAEFAIFALIGAAGLGLNEVILWLLAGQAGVHYMLAKMTSAAVVLFWNFGARKRLRFTRR